ncbi:MAG TPA: hypothetical protein VIG70_12700 [Burkholderiales bacterium]|jgi:hypothetical protein
MEHSEFVARSSANSLLWGVRGVGGAVLALWGASGLAWYALASLLALSPTLGIAAWAAAHGRYGALGWLVPGVLAFAAARPGLNLVAGSPWLACGLLGVAVSIWLGPLHLLGGAAVVATWILAGAVRGSALVSLQNRLLASSDDYERLRAAGKLSFTPDRRARG